LFKVGQVVYLIPAGERRVIPAQITEEILRRTLSGEETVWMIKIAGSQKSIPLDPEAAEYYTDVEVLRDILIQRTTQQVNNMLGKTVEIAEEAFGRPERPAVSFSVPEDLQEEETATVLLPDGTKAKVRTK
jgi:hypothetical protein